ncbi:GAF domain-containing protein [Hymenobacter sp. BT770]|uniref:GAF domain-containing protein n=1 Tax=Hymenobacter sp. BT770 TaxID=2886942 RepID=UPI001D11CAC1|nr:GAF domain-containing protein [Hymenobacter sp. BT770]MCC3152798.1 GAF domain-containing protein [Hymenobacter sp. BT770]MDO3414873.1 GAF domain-containing protein [Hymenobacter sp. BT770]
MIAPGLPANEPDRLRSLAEHNLLDTLPEEVYDDITRLAAEICGTPIAAINLIAGDRQWSKSTHNTQGDSQGLHQYMRGPRELSFCAHTIMNPDETMVVPDARYDERFMDNPLTTGDPHIVFYAGVPVKDAQDRALGSLCVIDSRPRELPEYKLESLRALAKLVNTHFQLRRTQIELDKTKARVDAAQPILQALTQAINSFTKESEEEQIVHLQSLQAGVLSLKNALELH